MMRACCRVVAGCALLVTLGAGWSWGEPPDIGSREHGKSRSSRGLRVTDLGTLGGSESFAAAINDRGQVVGISRIAGDAENHMFLYDQGSLIDLSAMYGIGPGLYAAFANAINNAGQIAASVPNGEAVLLSGGVMTNLGTNRGFYSTALGLNDTGQTVGYYASPAGFHHAFLYSDGHVTDIGPAGAEAISVATAINRRGTVVGYATSTYRAPYHGFVYRDQVMTDITPSGSSESYAEGINDRGDVVGTYLTADGSAFHAFLYRDERFIDLGSTGSPQSIAYAINNHGQIVGTTWVPYTDDCVDYLTGAHYACTNYKPHAFLYEKGRMIDLNTLIQKGSGWELAWAFAINNKGQVVGYGVVNGKYRSFLIQL